jgi:hemolysin activation/secretion protein
VNRPALTLAEIERRLLLAGDLPGITLRSALAAGAGAGSSVLIVEARHQGLTGSVGLDNSLSDALGRESFQFGLEGNALFGGAEQLYLRLGGWPRLGDAGFFGELPRNRLVGAGLVLPIGIDGLTLNLEATQAKTTPQRVEGFVETGSTFTRVSARLRHPLIRGRQATLHAEAAFDAQQDQLDAIAPVAEPLSEDDLRVVRLAGDGYVALPQAGVLSGRVMASFGLDAFGARKARADDRVPLSRQGVTPDFDKLEFALRYSQPLGAVLGLQFDGRAQSAFGQPLPRSEQIGLVSPSGLSSFDAGALQGDSGYVLRGELQATFPLPPIGAGLTPGVAPYLFAATGQIRQHEPTALERASVRASAYGLGLRLGLAPQASLNHVGLALEWGRQDRNDPAPTENRFGASLLVRF